jgi:hypothetical protein
MAKSMSIEVFAGNLPPISDGGRKARYDEITRQVASMLQLQESSSQPRWARWTNPPATLKAARATLLERAGQLRLNVGGERLRVAKALDDKGGFVVWIEGKVSHAAAASDTTARVHEQKHDSKPTSQPHSDAASTGDPRLMKLAKWLSRRPGFEATTSDTMQGTGASITLLEQMESAGMAVIGKDRNTGRKVISLTDKGVEVAGVSNHA